MVLLFFLTSAMLLAADENAGPIETDRPGFMHALSVLPRETVQLESGTTFATSSGSRSLTLGGHLVRLGLSKRVELRLTGDGYFHEGSGAGSRWAGGSAGVKVKLLEERRWFPGISIVPAIMVPMVRGASLYDPAFRVNWSKLVVSGLSIGGAADVMGASDELGRYSRRAASVAISRGIRRVSVFAETFVLDRVDRGGSRKTFVDGGMALPVTKDVQVDISAGQTVASAGRERFIAVGFSVRRNGADWVGRSRLARMLGGKE
jgi:hypothetical protein